MASLTACRSKFKSPLRVVARFLERSRETKARKCRELKGKLEESRRQLARQEAEAERDKVEIRELKQRVGQLEAREQRQAQAPLVWPEDPPVNGHGYGARMVSLSVNLARVVGLRGANRALKVMFEALGIQHKIPHATAIRTWVQRLGVAALREPLEPADDWIWIVDHSNQIGVEKVLVVLAVRASQLPPPGKALRHEDVRVLLVRPGTSWKREDMAAVYAELAGQHGAPRAILCDGAVELREGAQCLKHLPSETIVIQDFKHKAANFLKAMLGSDDRFALFNTQLGKTRSAIQQTELAHLTPPGQKQKARFMNLHATLKWGAATCWVLDQPQAQARKSVTAERLEEKLGWMRSFTNDLAVWRECQQVINKGVTFVNEQGVFDGAAEKLRAELFSEARHPTSRILAEQLIGIIANAQSQLKQGERLPLSTEILESSFALYKHLERQHSKGGFTSLLAGFGALLRKTTQEMVQEAFSRVSVKEVKQWVSENLGETLTSKRRALYQEYKRDTQGATQLATVS